MLFLNAGYYVLYQVRLAEIKEGMRKEFLRTRRDEFTRFVFSSKETRHIEWEEENEFRYKGEMYDVVEMEKKGDQVIIVCIADKKEKALKEEFAKTHQSPERSPCNSISKLLKAPFLVSLFPRQQFSSSPADTQHAFYLLAIPFLAHKVLTPPPKTC